MKRLGPELKMPDLKGLKDLDAPAWLADLYFDLRERRLLPLIALVVVAIAAVPFLLGGSEEELPPPVADEIATGEAATGLEPATLTVVEATPGLRDYKKRLKRRSPTDPFVPRYTSVPPQAKLESVGPGAGGDGGEATTMTEATGGGDGGTPPSSSPPSTGGSPSGGDGGSGGKQGSGGKTGSGDLDPTKPGLRFYDYRPNIRFGVAGSGELREHRHLKRGKFLPKRNPVILFFGSSENGNWVAFDISPEVQLVKTPGRCIGGPQSCGTLILKAGQAANIVTGKPNRNFRLKVTGIDFVEVFKKAKPAGKSSRQERIGFGFAVVGQFGSSAPRP